jgi:hypothetical protein
MAGFRFCYFHNPKAKKARLNAQRRGGLRPKRRPIAAGPSVELFDLAKPAGISKLLNYAANGLLRGEIEARDANAYAQLGRCALDAHRAGQLAEEVERLERRCEADQGRPAPSGSNAIEFEFEKDDSAAAEGSASKNDGGRA